MRKPAPRFGEARQAFVEALHAYQVATRDMNAALTRLSAHTGTFCESLSGIVTLSQAMLTPRRQPGGRPAA